MVRCAVVDRNYSGSAMRSREPKSRKSLTVPLRFGKRQPKPQSLDFTGRTDLTYPQRRIQNCRFLFTYGFRKTRERKSHSQPNATAAHTETIKDKTTSNGFADQNPPLAERSFHKLKMAAATGKQKIVPKLSKKKGEPSSRNDHCEASSSSSLSTWRAL